MFLKLVNEDNTFRYLFLQMIIKAADLSDCCRSFNIANLYKNFVPLEFFVQGKIDTVEGFEFWGLNVKNRKRLKTNASTIHFYKNVCLPFFNILATLSPHFEESVLQLNENIKKWESMPIENDILTEKMKKEIEEEENKNEDKKESKDEIQSPSKSQGVSKITFGNIKEVEKVTQQKSVDGGEIEEKNKSKQSNEDKESNKNEESKEVNENKDNNESKDNRIIEIKEG